MVSGIDGIGEAVTGGMVARAVEPEAGEKAEAEHGACLNCGAVLDGPFCRACGQKAHVHRSLGAFGHDLIHGVLHLDGKFWRTLPLLVWRPGELTRRYAHGERAKFVSPLAMFLFSIFLMFAVLSIFGLSLASLDVGVGNQARHGIDIARADVVRELGEARERRARLERGETVRRRQQPVTRAQLDQEIVQREEQLRAIDTLRTGVTTFQESDTSGVNTGWARLDYGIKKIAENPGLALYKLQSNSYKFSWLLIPISVPFLWLMFFWTRRYHLYDHTVFVTYSLAFMSLFAVLLTVLGFVGVSVAIIAPAAVFIPPIHMFRQLKQAYQLHWFGALVRTFLLLNFCLFTVIVFVLLLVGIGAVG